MPVKITAVLDTRRPVKSGLFPVKIRVTYQRTQKYFQAVLDNVAVYLTPEDWERVRSDRPRNEFKTLALKISALEQKAYDCAGECNPFTFQEFSDRFREIRAERVDVFAYFRARIAEIESQNTKGVYQGSYDSLKAFCRCESLSFFTVTPAWLTRYVRWMEQQGKSSNTALSYLHPLMAAFNHAKSKGIIREEHYPFGRHKFQPPRFKGNKRALTLEQLVRLATADLTGQKAWARDVFLLSYLLGGLNMADLIPLRWETIRGNTIYLKRRKTDEETRLEIIPEAWAIVGRYSTPRKLAGYVFPYVEDRATERRKMVVVSGQTSKLNRTLKEIAAELKLPEGLSTYYSRHTFATLARNELNIPLSAIQSMMAHADLKTTQGYFSGYEEKQRAEYAEKLAVWKTIAS